MHAKWLRQETVVCNNCWLLYLYSNVFANESRWNGTSKLLLFGDSLGVFDPIFLLLVGQDGDLSGWRGAGSAVNLLWTWGFLQLEPATQDKGLTMALAGCQWLPQTGRNYSDLLDALHQVIDRQTC